MSLFSFFIYFQNKNCKIHNSVESNTVPSNSFIRIEFSKCPFAKIARWNIFALTNGRKGRNTFDKKKWSINNARFHRMSARQCIIHHVHRSFSSCWKNYPPEDHPGRDRVNAGFQTSRSGSSREKHRLYYKIMSCHAGGTPIMSRRLGAYQKHARIPPRWCVSPTLPHLGCLRYCIYIRDNEGCSKGVHAC